MTIDNFFNLSIRKRNNLILGQMNSMNNKKKTRNRIFCYRCYSFIHFSGTRIIILIPDVFLNIKYLHDSFILFMFLFGLVCHQFPINNITVIGGGGGGVFAHPSNRNHTNWKDECRVWGKRKPKTGKLTGKSCANPES